MRTSHRIVSAMGLWLLLGGLLISLGHAPRAAAEPVAVAASVDVAAATSNAGWSEMGAGSASGGGISVNTSALYYPSLAIGPDNMPVVAWTSYINANDRRTIYLKRWDGAAWVEIGGSASGYGISNNAVGQSYFPVVAIDPDGNPVVAWFETISGQNGIYVKRWTGSAWVEIGGSASGSGIRQGAGQASVPSLAIDPDGNPVVAWMDSGSGNYEIYVKRWTGSAWVEMDGSASGGGISGAVGQSGNPSLAIGPDGNPVVAWQNISGSQDRIHVKRWNGETWEEMDGSATGSGISPDTGRSLFPSVAIGLDGAPVVAWEDRGSGNFEIYVKRWTGSTWAEMGGSASGSGISGAVGWSERPSVAIAPDGAPVIAWQGSSHETPEIYVRRWNGAAWEEMDDGSASGGGISNTAGFSFSLSLAIGPDGTPVIAWTDSSTGSFEIYVKRWNGSAWVEMGAGSASGGGISQSAGSSGDPSLAIGPDGAPVVAWENSGSGNIEVYVKRWNGSAWVEMGAGSASGGGISQNNGVSGDPSLAIGPDGAPVVAWGDNSGGNREIYARRYAGGQSQPLPYRLFMPVGFHMP